VNLWFVSRMIEIFYSGEARKDLRSILDYIHFDLGNPKAARGTLNKIVKDIEKLSYFPLSGASLDAVTDFESDFRYIATCNYLVFYRLDENKIHIDRIISGKRDYIRVLFG